MNTNTEQNDPDWIYKPMLRSVFSTRTDYDSSGIEQETLEEFEQIQKTESEDGE